MNAIRTYKVDFTSFIFVRYLGLPNIDNVAQDVDFLRYILFIIDFYLLFMSMKIV